MSILEPNLLTNHPPHIQHERALPQQINEIVQRSLVPADLEVHPFLVGWYNELVGPKFTLNFPDDTVALAVISGPNVFEKSVIPYLQNQKDRNAAFSTIDPLDEAMKYTFHLFSKELEADGYDVEVFHDFELFPNRRPKVLVQTAAHVAGAAEYFLQSRLTSNELAPNKKLFGVAIHPSHGGWFAIRGIVILKNLQRDWRPHPPLNLLTEESQIATLLEQFTYNWKANIWRDVLPPKHGTRYSLDFLEYLDMHPDQRWKFIQEKGYLEKVQGS